MQKREKLLLIFTIGLVALMIVKSVALDEVRPQGQDEVKFKSFVEKRIEDGKEELGLLNKTGLVAFRIVKIEKTSENGETTILYFEEEQNTYVEGIIKGEYKARVRGYLLYVIPYREFTVGVVR